LSKSYANPERIQEIWNCFSPWDPPGKQRGSIFLTFTTGWRHSGDGSRRWSWEIDQEIEWNSSSDTEASMKERFVDRFLKGPGFS
jgi:hypothetical protein